MSLLDIHNRNGYIHRQRILIAPFGGHLVLQSIQMDAHVPRAHMGRMLEVGWVPYHGPVYPPPPLRRWLLRDAAGEALHPDVTHPPTALQMLTGTMLFILQLSFKVYPL